MKRSHFTVVLLASLLSSSSFAQPGTDRVIVEGVSSSSNKTEGVKKADVNVAQEKAELNELAKKTLTPCEEEDLRARVKDIEFYEAHKAQIEDLVFNISAGLRKQKSMLEGFENGMVVGIDAEMAVNAHGETEKSALVSVKSIAADGTETKRIILLTDLIRYIRRFESEIQKVGDSNSEVNAFLVKYRAPETANDPEFFKMTLDEAMYAYRVRLSGVFARSTRQSQTRELIQGEGKKYFAVSTTTLLGYDPKYSAAVGSEAYGNSKGPLPITTIQSFGEAFNTAGEGAYWEIIRMQQLTIDGIPIDGLQRRNYFNSFKSEACNSDGAIFSDRFPGPYLSKGDFADLKNSACICPVGMTYSPTNKICTKRDAVDPTGKKTTVRAVVGDDNGSYYSRPGLMTVVQKERMPFSLQPGGSPSIIDADKKTFSNSSYLNGKDPSFQFWRDRVVGSNRVSVREANDVGNWVTKTVCIDLDQTKEYIVHVGADNRWQVHVNGVEMANCHDSYCFYNGLFLQKMLTAGKNVVELKYYNEGGPGAVWFEIFANGIQDIPNVKSEKDLSIIYSSKAMQSGYWDYVGQICPDGYVYDSCNPDNKCVSVKTAECRR